MREFFFLHAALFAYRNGMGRADGLLAISPSEVLRYRDGVQLDFRSAFDRVSYSSLLFKLKSIGVAAWQCAVQL